MVRVHPRSKFYALAELRAGRAELFPIERVELGGVQGVDIFRLPFHFGYDSPILARKGAEVAGLDLSAPAIAAARDLAAELGVAARARFVEADV